MKVGFERVQLLAPLAKFEHELTFGLTLQPDRSWLKAAALYSSASRDEWPCPVSVETSRGYIQWRGGNAAGATGGQKHVRRT